MAYEVVARRWRPLTFDSVVGQSHVTTTLGRAIERDRVAHAFLFTGIRGVGKTTMARILARALNCTNRQGAEPCNECSSCVQVLSGSSVDVLEIDGASNNGVDEVRALIEAAQYCPAGGRYRVYIIDEVHQLSKPAFNALLKILEEPPSHVKFVLATTESHKVLPTVLSRCQRYDFRRLTIGEITGQLEQIVERDELEVSKDALALIAREADGSMRDAQSLLEQVAAATGGQADAGDVQSTLGIAGTELIIGAVTGIVRRDGAAVVKLVHEIRDSGHDVERVLHEILELVRHVCVAASAGGDALDPAVGEGIRDAAVSLKDERHVLDLHRIFNSLLRTSDDLRHGAMAELVFEMGLLKAASLESVVASSEILAMLDGAPAPRPTSRPAASGGPARGPERPASGSSASPAGSSRQGGGDDPKTQSHASAPQPAAGGQPARPSQDAPEPPHPGDPPASRQAEAPRVEELSPSAEKWQGFLEAVPGLGGAAVSVALGNCELVSLDTGRVVVRPMMAMVRQQLEEQKMRTKLQDLVHGHFGDDVKLEIVGTGRGATSGAGTGAGASARSAPTTTAGSTEAVSSHSIEEQRRAKVEQDAMDEPLVQAAVNMGGKVRKISSIED